MSLIIEILREIWDTLSLMAPYLLLGYLIAGVLSIFVTPAFVERHLGKPGLVSTVKAAVFGMPLPLCSCGVLPVTASLRKHGAGRGATTSFLVSTPTTGVDSILVAWGMLGPFFALYRAVLAVVLGICAGTLADLFGDDGDDSFVGDKQEEKKSCCSGHAQEEQVLPFLQRAKKALTFGFLTLPKDIGRPLMIGIVVAGLIAGMIHADYIPQFLKYSSVLAMLVMLVVGLPLYVCATASVPMALAFIYMGATPGAALIFLIVGPATNAATIGILWKMIGKRSTIATVVTLIVGALAAGILLDLAWYVFDVPPIIGEDGVGHAHLTVWHSVAAVLLLAVQFFSAWRVKLLGWFKGAAPVGGASCCSHTSPKPVAEESCCSHEVEENSAPAPDSCCCGESKSAGVFEKKSSSCCCGSDSDSASKSEKKETEADCCHSGQAAEDVDNEKPQKDGEDPPCCCGEK